MGDEYFKSATKVVVDRFGSVVQALDALPLDVGADHLHGIESIGALTVDNSAHTFSFASVAYWHHGRRFESAAPVSVDVDDHLTLLAGTRVYIYFSDASGVLRASTVAWSIADDVMMCAAFWNGSAFAVTAEHHGYRRDLDWHKWAHLTVGARLGSAADYGLTAPSVASPASVDIGAGTLYDEDLATAHGQQTNCRVWYQNGASSYTFQDSNSIYPSIGVAFADSAAAYALTAVGTAAYINVWLYASSDVDRGIYAFVETKATAGYNTVAQARAASPPTLSGFGLTPELKLLYRVIMRGNETFEEVTDYRLSSSLPAGGLSNIAAAAVTTVPGASPYNQAQAQAYLEALAAGKAESAHGHTESLGMTIDGGGAAIATGSKRFRTVPFGCTLSGWRVLADQAGSIVVDVKRATYAAFPTTASLVGAGTKPGLSAAQKNEGAVSNWSAVALAAGDVLEFVVDSAATATWAVVDLQYTRSA